MICYVKKNDCMENWEWLVTGVSICGSTGVSQKETINDFVSWKPDPAGFFDFGF